MKNIRPKKQSSNKQYVIASVGRVGSVADSQAIHANLTDSNSSEAIENHYKELIAKGLDAEKIDLVVTDMLPAYAKVISKLFPNAEQQFCIFHLVQHINQDFKDALKQHRHQNFKVGQRKEAHLTALLMLKGQEKLTESERNEVLTFCDQHPMVAADYACKEDIRFMYNNAKSLIEVLFYKDFIMETYTHLVSPKMLKMLEWLSENFEKTIAYIKKGYFRDKTNNDAERLMRKIKRIQQTHYFIRNPNNYIRKIRVIIKTHRKNAD